MKTAEEKRAYRREYMRKYNASKKGQEYNRKHVKKWRADGNRKPEKRQISREWKELIIDFLIKRDGFLCGFCGKSLEGEKISIDHTIPIAHGGKNIMENTRLSHFLCNVSKGSQIRQNKLGY